MDKLVARCVKWAREHAASDWSEESLHKLLKGES